jgi:outer membrane beta-barrel protein
VRLFAGLTAALLTSFAAFSAENARAQGDADVAIQRQKFQMAHELTLSLGSMPRDAFQKGWVLGMAYSIHFEPWLAWQVIDARAAALSSTDLRDELIDTFAIAPDDFNAPRFMATTGVEITPIYGKQVFLNDTVVHQAIYAGMHAGVIFGDRGALADTLGDLRPVIGLGVGYRFFLSKSFSVRIDFRDFISFKRAIKERDRADVDNVILLSAGISANFWRDDA